MNNHHHGDDRSSSGYRSSSSPSIQSEELYANESAVASMEDLNCDKGFRDIAIETTLEKEPKVKGGKSKKIEEEEKYQRTSKAFAKLFENGAKEEKKKKKKKENEDNVPKFDIPNDDFVTIGEIAGGNESEEEVIPPPPPPAPVSNSSLLKVKVKKQAPKPVESEHKKMAEFEKLEYNAPKNLEYNAPKNLEYNAPKNLEYNAPKNLEYNAPKPLEFAPQTMEKSNEIVGNTQERKKGVQKDRSVDVYHETVRQRASKKEQSNKKVSSRQVFELEGEKVEFPNEIDFEKESKSKKSVKHFGDFLTKKTSISKKKAPILAKMFSNESEKLPEPDIVPEIVDHNREERDRNDDDDMPCVRQLRSKFERPSSPPRREINEKPKKPFKFPENSGKKSGFLVMSSLTRRGAVAVSKSLHNIAIENNANSKSEDRFVDDQSIFASKDLKFGSSGFSKKAHKSHKTNHKTEEKKVKPMKMIETKRECHPIVDQKGHFSYAGLVAKLYHLEDISPEEMRKNSAEAAHKEGHLERLPQGKKRSTLWNSWKKQFFVADRGILQSYADQSRSAPLETIELFGGQVRFEEGQDEWVVVDRRGHTMALRCSDKKETKTWIEALEANMSQDFSKSFVTPNPWPRSPSVFTNVLVIDFGGASVRAGVASEMSLPTLPQLFFPSVMAVEHSNEQAKYFGLDAFADEVRSRSKLSHPIVPSHKVDKYSVDQIALQGIFEKIFKDLALEPNDYEIQLSVPRTFSDSTKHAIAAMLFDEFGVESVNMGHQTVFAFYAYNAQSGVMVDLGERMDVVPIVHGYKVDAGVSRSPVGGKELRDKLQHYLLGRNYSLTSFVDSFITRYTLEKSAYFCANFDAELDKCGKDPEKFDQTVEICPPETVPESLPVGGGKIELNSERFEACEGLFKPELWGLDQAGVHVLVHKAIKECSVDVRKEMTCSIFLSGGLTLIPGFRRRLESEVEKLVPAKPRVHASPFRYHAAFLGAMKHAGSKEFQKTKVTKQEWVNRRGAKLDRYWAM